METSTQANMFSTLALDDIPQPLVLGTKRRGATFVEHHVKGLVNSPKSTGMGFWSINPYIGCEFGCTYCYARDAHRYVTERTHRQGDTSDVMPQTRRYELWEAFEHRIYVKRRNDVLVALERDLPHIHSYHHHKQHHPIVIGTATDPYQPAEQSFSITQSILTRLLKERGLSIAIITKSPLIRRDIDLLYDLQQRHRLTVYVSLISTSIPIIKQFEARSPMPHARLRTLEYLSASGIYAGLIVAPILPGITDTDEQLDNLFVAVKSSGGQFANPSPLRLSPAMHRSFLPIIKQHYPSLYEKYRRTYRGAGSVSRYYTEHLNQHFRERAECYGISSTDRVIESRRRLQICNEGNKQIELPLFGRNTP